jgi:hypothetical protein
MQKRVVTRAWFGSEVGDFGSAGGGVVESGVEAPLGVCTAGDRAGDLSSTPLPHSLLCRLQLLLVVLFETAVAHNSVVAFCVWLVARL